MANRQRQLIVDLLYIVISMQGLLGNEPDSENEESVEVWRLAAKVQERANKYIQHTRSIACQPPNEPYRECNNDD